VRDLTIDLGERSYPIRIGSGLLADPAATGPLVAAHEALIVSDENVAPLYLAALERGLAGRRLASLVLPAGETHKTLATAARVFDALVDARMHRDACVIALGGGVVGDIAGFAAACYQRGVDCVQVPTTLLAQVDSSVGGKTGVDHPGGKNLIGAFHQPRAVLVDLATLATLPPRELRAGMAEVIKYGLLGDAGFLEWLEEHLDAALALDESVLEPLVRRCCELKAEIVAVDERERGGRRALLNLGHTFGHAIETATGYGEWLHGEAVATGIAVAADLSRRLGWLGTAEVERVVRLLVRAGLPTTAPPIGAARALELMGLDKKVQAGRIRLVLLRHLGEAVFTADLPAGLLQETLAAHFDPAVPA
jgi:3-dehydroquinate synthase